MALLEGAEAARATATGMAAVTAALMGQVKAGDHVVAAKALFGSCRYVVEELLPRFGVASTLVDGTDLDAWQAAVRQNTKTVLSGIADQSDARSRRYRRRSPRSRTRRRDPGRRQCVRDAAAARARSRSAPIASSIRPPNISTARAACSAASSSAPRSSSPTTIHNSLRQTGPSPVAVQRLDAAESRWRPCRSACGADATAPARIADFLSRPHEDHATALSRPRRSSAGRARPAADERRSARSCSFEVEGGKEGAFRVANALPIIGISNNLGDAKSLSPIRRRPRISG